jgi:hypothetical protein
MRVGIYVYSPTTVTLSHAAEAVKYVPDGEPRTAVTLSGQAQLAPGIYRIVTDQPLQVAPGDGAEVIFETDPKNPWPDPKTQLHAAAFTAAFPAVSHTELQKFFPAIARDVGKVSDAR